MSNKRIFKKIVKKGSKIIMFKEKSKLFVEKIYEENSKDKINREFVNTNKVAKILEKNNFKQNSFIAISKNDNSIIQEFVKGNTLQEELISNPNKLDNKIKELGVIFNLLQKEFKIKEVEKKDLIRILKNNNIKLPNLYLKNLNISPLFYKNKLFAAATDNFIIRKDNIVPIDLGSKDEQVINFEQLTRFLCFFYIVKPQHIINYNWKKIKQLENLFLESYFKEINLNIYTLLTIFKIQSFNQIKNKKSQNILQFIKNSYLKLICNYQIRKLKNSLEEKNLLKKELELFSKKINNKIDWSFYKADIIYPQVVDDIDLVCREDEEEVTKILKNLKFKKLSSHLFEFENKKYHFHYQNETHTKFLGKDIGSLILDNKVNLQLPRPKYYIWVLVRIIYVFKKPKKWLVKQFRRILE